MQAALTARPTVRPVARPAVRSATKPRFVAFSTAPKPEQIQAAIKEAEETCAGGSTGECAAAWDTVEELSAAASHAKDAEKADPKSTDPLEQFCEGNPDADECRVYED